MTTMDDDERQEYECLLLEGYDHDQARKLARQANNRVNSRRLSGPLTGDTRHGHGVRPIISDMTDMDIYADSPSITMDWRTDEEREADHSRSVPDVTEILSWLAPRQREFVIHKFGIGVEPAGSEQELADRLGVTKHTVQSALKAVRKKVLDIQEAGGYNEWQARVHLAKYQGGNQGRKRRYRGYQAAN